MGALLPAESAPPLVGTAPDLGTLPTVAQCDQHAAVVEYVEPVTAVAYADAAPTPDSAFCRSWIIRRRFHSCRWWRGRPRFHRCKSLTGWTWLRAPFRHYPHFQRVARHPLWELLWMLWRTWNPVGGVREDRLRGHACTCGTSSRGRVRGSSTCSRERGTSDHSNNGGRRRLRRPRRCATTGDDGYTQNG